MSLEGVGESHFTRFVMREVLKGYIVFPPGTVVKVDLLFAEVLVVVEVEDTVEEIYSGTRQLGDLARVARVYNADFVLIAPFPKVVQRAIMPISYFFRQTDLLGLKRRELWLVVAGRRVGVIALRYRGTPPVRLRPKVPELVVEVSRDEIDRLIQTLVRAKDRLLVSHTEHDTPCTRSYHPHSCPKSHERSPTK